MHISVFSYLLTCVLFCFTKAKYDTHAGWSKYEVKSEGAPKHSGEKGGKKLVASFAKNFNVFFCNGVGGERKQKWGEMNGGSKGSLVGFVILFSYPVPSERIDLIWKFGSVLSYRKYCFNIE